VIVSPRALPPGTTLGSYQIESLLGQGPFGLTYRTCDLSSGARVAIKEYLPTAYAVRGPDHSVSSISDLEQEDFEFGMLRFRDDARALQQIDHPSIVKVLEVFDANGTVCMVMPYEDGLSLADALKREPPLTEWDLLNMAASLIDAMKVLHGAGLIHRDVKEAHIKLRADGMPVLLDFGAARVGLLRRRLALGTGNPDLDPAKLDGSAGPWTDIHALAAMLFRIAKRPGSAGCSPRIVEALRAGITVQPGDFERVTVEWGRQIAALLQELPVPERPAPQPIPAPPEDIAVEPLAFPSSEQSRTDAGAVAAHSENVAVGAPSKADAHTSGSVNGAGELARESLDTPVVAQATAADDEADDVSGAVSIATSDEAAAAVAGEVSTPPEPIREEAATATVDNPEPAPLQLVAIERDEQTGDRLETKDAGETAGVVSVQLLRPRAVTPAVRAESDPTRDLDRLTRWVAAAAVVAIVFGAVMWMRDARTPPPALAAAPPIPATVTKADTPPTAAQDALAVTASVPAVTVHSDDSGALPPAAPTATPAAVPEPPAPEASTTKEIEGLLAAAAKDVAELRLTTPRGNNAVEKYQSVLALDPDNDAARQGLRTVSDRYVDLAGTALGRNQFAAARRYLELAQSIAPDNANVQALRRELEARQQQPPRRSAEETVAAEWHGGLYDRVQDFLETNQARPPQPPSRADQIPDRLGGQR
jgi:hypothetical protein